jgi:hypothetical protein
MGKNIYKTASGQHIDIDTLRLVNESTVSVGNMSVNARGDEVRPDGSIIRTRNEIMKEHYNRNIEPVVRYNPNKRRPSADESIGSTVESNPNAVINTPQTIMTPAPENDSTLRGSLASSVSIDLVQDPEQPTKRTITRI